MVRSKTRLPARQIASGLCCVVRLLLAAGCETPVSVTRVDAETLRRELTGNALTADELSPSARNVLRRWVLSERYDSDPEGAIAALHTITVDGRGSADEVITLAEMAFLYAENSQKRPYFLALVSQTAESSPTFLPRRSMPSPSYFPRRGLSRRAPMTRACGSPPISTALASSTALPRPTALLSRSGAAATSCLLGGST
jgi:hypothetical protein